VRFLVLAVRVVGFVVFFEVELVSFALGTTVRFVGADAFFVEVDLVRAVDASDFGLAAIFATLFTGESAASATVRTRRIALVCSASVVRNSWCPSVLATK
jgi:hypothetical protein